MMTKTFKRFVAALWLIVGLMPFFLGTLAGEAMIYNKPYTYAVLFGVSITMFFISSLLLLFVSEANKYE